MKELVKGFKTTIGVVIALAVIAIIVAICSIDFGTCGPTERDSLCEVTRKVETTTTTTTTTAPIHYAHAYIGDQFVPLD